MAITTPAPRLDETGMHAPTYGEVLGFLQEKYRGIYGDDVYLAPDSQDGQLLAVFASAIHDANSAALATYNAFSPATAVGEALSRNVRINGIRRAAHSYATVDVRIVGVVGTTLVNGIVIDADQRQWRLPPQVVIPASGDVTVTATCSVPGAITAAPGTLSRIGTPTLGWQSVSNPAPATPGAAVETDAALRLRQATSVALPSRTVLEGIVGAVAAIEGVARYAAYENDTNATDANGIPAHSLALVVDGGDGQRIAEAIARKKTPGAGTYGSSTESVSDMYGRPITIRYFRPTPVPVTVAVTLKALPGYTTAIGDQIRQAVAEAVNSVPIGGGAGGVVEWGDVLSAANGVAASRLFKLAALALSGPAGAGTPDVPLAFNEAARCTPEDVSLTVN
ncbi:FIG00643583: hypothetical protein [plant metagenome]|uniref:Baseplate protein J-like barrel domain-containing protein n=1 Tax=plant metagenome TaxID=1297885 RepID=A0A484XMI7_9ZZZZ